MKSSHSIMSGLLFKPINNSSMALSFVYDLRKMFANTHAHFADIFVHDPKVYTGFTYIRTRIHPTLVERAPQGAICEYFTVPIQ